MDLVPTRSHKPGDVGCNTDPSYQRAFLLERKRFHTPPEAVRSCYARLWVLVTDTSRNCASAGTRCTHTTSSLLKEEVGRTHVATRSTLKFVCARSSRRFSRTTPTPLMHQDMDKVLESWRHAGTFGKAAAPTKLRKRARSPHPVRMRLWWNGRHASLRC